MLVEQIMQSTLVTVTPETTLSEARRLTRQRGIRHLLVVDGGRLVWIVSDRDLKGAPGQGALGDVVQIVESTGTRISGIMTLESPDGGREVVIRVPTINPAAAVHALSANGYALTTPWRG